MMMNQKNKSSSRVINYALERIAKIRKGWNKPNKSGCGVRPVDEIPDPPHPKKERNDEK